MSANPTPAHSSPRRPVVQRLKMWVLISVSVVVLAAVLGVAGQRAYRGFRQKRMIKHGREFYEKKDYLQAAMSLRRALQIDANDIEANRLLAEVMEAANVPEAVYRRRIVAQLQPESLDSVIAWATSALRFKDTAAAEEALAKVNDAGKQTAVYHEVAALLAAAKREPKNVTAHVAEAARLEPKNDTYQLQMASMRLASQDPAVRRQAFGDVEKFAADPKLRRPALRNMLQAAASGGDVPQALGYAERLKDLPEAEFADRMLYLDLLRQIGRREFWWGLAQIFAERPIDPERMASVIAWLNNNGGPKVTQMLSDRIPPEVRVKPPVSVALAESYAKLRDWAGLKPVLKYGEWGPLEYERHGLFARVLKEEGDDTGFRSQWSMALTAAGDRPEALKVLLGFTTAWQWEDEHINVLRVIARGRVDPDPALAVLLRHYTAKDKTREMLGVFTRMLELDPQNAALKNNVAYTSLLMNTNTDKATALAAEAHSADPTNPDFAATYGYALHMARKKKESLKIISSIDTTKQSSPSIALARGIVLGEAGEVEKARESLDRAAAGHLLPEEIVLLGVAREKLSRR